MYKFLCSLFAFMIIGRATGQVLPREGSMLNFRLIGFSAPPMNQATDPVLEIAKGNFHSGDLFKKNILASVPAPKNKVVAEVPFFGTDYTWRWAYKSGATMTYGDFHHFSTGKSSRVDTTGRRLRILKASAQKKDFYFLINGSGALYDINGEPIWYMPEINGSEFMPSDINPTPFGTLTFLFFGEAYETDFSGNILWKGPNNGKISGDSCEYYNHEFTRLSNGHYMVMGSQQVPSSTVIKQHLLRDSLFARALRSSPEPVDTSFKIPFGTIIEYDDKGNVLWNWKAYDYFVGSDALYCNHTKTARSTGMHENSFFFDEKNKTFYVSCKEISRIIKLKYPECTVMNNYGETYSPEVPYTQNSLFCAQHCIRHSDNGYIYLYNNNMCNEQGNLPAVDIFTEPATGKGTLKKIWEYQCTNEGLDTNKFSQVKVTNTQGKILNRGQTAGGNVMEMPDKTMFVAMNGPYCKLFIVNRDKQLLWSALPEKWDEKSKDWKAISQYRSGVITSRKDLERLIWRAEAGVR